MRKYPELQLVQLLLAVQATQLLKQAVQVPAPEPFGEV